MSAVPAGAENWAATSPSEEYDELALSFAPLPYGYAWYVAPPPPCECPVRRF